MSAGGKYYIFGEKKEVLFVVITGEGVFIMNSTKAMLAGFWDKLFPPWPNFLFFH